MPDRHENTSNNSELEKGDDQATKMQLRFSRFSNMECRVHSLMQNTSDHNPIRTIIQSASQIVKYMCSRSTAASSMLDVERSNAFSNVISVPGAGPLRSFGYHQGGFFNK
jgi:hypothetical protein